ncbi:hypothetical protein P7K49_020587 [Saguinus oedipus]|uniref:Uncharacterized protein n=1 Tax=Saguinus oedipus TaxID=9490 RepID=A0ABQ9V0V6_SAGOE|nr:hypothetical protein P7K49_020587 [Saguinus oedipus]
MVTVQPVACGPALSNVTETSADMDSHEHTSFHLSSEGWGRCQESVQSWAVGKDSVLTQEQMISDSTEARVACESGSYHTCQGSFNDSGGKQEALGCDEMRDGSSKALEVGAAQASEEESAFTPVLHPHLQNCSVDRTLVERVEIETETRIYGEVPHAGQESVDPSPYAGNRHMI